MSEARNGVNPAFARIEALTLAARPLIVCDVDEVVLQFIAPLERLMNDAGMEFIDHRYRLTGNIRHVETGDLASRDEVRALLHGFFEDHGRLQTPVPGAADALNQLSERAQVVMLTNMPARFLTTREEVLARNGISFPVIVNDGPKGPAVSALAERVQAPLVFLDDSPSNLTSVRDTVEEAHIIQFIADPRFFALADPVEGARLISNDWTVTRRYIETVIQKEARSD
ncbi:hypothetical protein C8N35_102184 [Breoghania corrubedonensis]|uniref:Beta-phosphoglucomutase-like phosphatase (HAD superfamily) n=1 Tax=Breoghania corrubedonensis TaxID=665038 RepID=A0A2T5VCK8_9HYPH|nr:hypothetical protein [Breoghania corrubedonensis]PTW61474.1 hypothetical protein C8N35_102184 [Breoghania corrubedonensis]